MMKTMWRKPQKIVAAIAVLGLLTLAARATANQPIRIVATTTDLADLARVVAGERARISALCGANEDPHFLQAKPSFITQARRADLWICIGMDLEIGWEPAVLNSARNPRIMVGQLGYLDVSQQVLKREVPTTRVTRDQGDVHPAGNPHYWLDPWNGRVIAAQIAARLSLLFPEDAARFAANLVAFQQALDKRMFGPSLVGRYGGDQLWRLQLDGEVEPFLAQAGETADLGGWLAAMRPQRGRQLIAFHKSWIYFTARFGMSVPMELEPKPGIPPTAAHLVQVEDYMRVNGIDLILQETFYSRRAADRVARNAGAHVLVLPAHVGGAPTATDYLSLIDTLVEALPGP